MSKLFDLNKELVDLTNALYFLDPGDEDDAIEIEKIERSLVALFELSQSKVDWIATIIHEADFALQAADKIAKHFAKKKKTAEVRLEFFKSLALDFMIKHDIRESRGELFAITRSLTPGAIVFESGFDAELLPDKFVETIPAVPEHKEPIKSELSAALRGKIKNEKGVLDKEIQRVTDESLPGVILVRNESLKIK